MNNTYLLLRHGKTPYQAERKGMIYPWPEPSPILLTKKGEGEVKKSARKLKKEKIDIIYSSDISRTRQTSGIVAKEIDSEVIFDARLRDINQGIYKGGPQEEYLRFFSSPIERLSKRPPQGESWDDVRRRMTNILEEIDKKYKNKRILIVSHKGPLWILETAVKKLGNSSFLEMKQKGLSTGQFRELLKKVNL